MASTFKETALALALLLLLLVQQCCRQGILLADSQQPDKHVRIFHQQHIWSIFCVDGIMSAV